MKNTLAVGQVAYLFDINRRKYTKPEPGQHASTGSCIYAEHWTEVTVESTRSGGHITVSGGRTLRRDHRGIYAGDQGRIRLALSQAEMDADIYLNTHRHGITRAVQHCTDVDILRRIAALLGYDDTSK